MTRKDEISLKKCTVRQKDLSKEEKVKGKLNLLCMNKKVKCEFSVKESLLKRRSSPIKSRSDNT